MVRFVFSTFAVLGLIAPAGAADLEGGTVRGGYLGATRAVPLVYYDYEPGVEMRAYWATPWRGIHYFPSSNETPRLGRRENLKVGSKPKRAESFLREWTSFPVDVMDAPPPLAPPQGDVTRKDLPLK
jgi:hypothetical protein